MLVACRLASLSALGAQLCVRQIAGNAGASTAPRIRTTQAPPTLRHRLLRVLWGPWVCAGVAGCPYQGYFTSRNLHFTFRYLQQHVEQRMNG
jgi:hypothetical protein